MASSTRLSGSERPGRDTRRKRDSSKPWRVSRMRLWAGAVGTGLRPRCESDAVPGRDDKAGCPEALGGCLEM